MIESEFLPEKRSDNGKESVLSRNRKESHDSFLSRGGREGGGTDRFFFEKEVL
jgi:hypothetical protein